MVGVPSCDDWCLDLCDLLTVWTFINELFDVFPHVFPPFVVTSYEFPQCPFDTVVTGHSFVYTLFGNEVVL